jgi:hypothetical protein
MQFFSSLCVVASASSSSSAPWYYLILSFVFSVVVVRLNKDIELTYT